MPVTVGGTGITFNNGTVQTTAASSPSTDFGAVGTYVVAVSTQSSNLATGGTIAGSNLRYDNNWTSFVGGVSRTNNSTFPGGGTALSGTWRKMSSGISFTSSFEDNGYGGTTTYYWLQGLYVRVS